MNYNDTTWHEAVEVILDEANSTCQCMSAAEGTYTLKGNLYNDTTTDCISASDCSDNSCTCPPKNYTYSDTIIWSGNDCNAFTITGQGGNFTFSRVVGRSRKQVAHKAARLRVHLQAAS